MQMPDAHKMRAEGEEGYQGPSADVREVYEGSGKWQPPMSGGGANGEEMPDASRRLAGN